MNQILETKPKKFKIKQFTVIFTISIILVIFFLVFYSIILYKNNQDHNFSESISKNYKVYKLFAEENNKKDNMKSEDICGYINIPKIKVYYPFFYGISDELLKIFPCRVSGLIPPQNSNLCIAGHNYNDDRFFSKINNLDLGDRITIENTTNNMFDYYVYDKYEIPEDKINLAVNGISSNLQLTLITCNNLNNKRIIIKAKTESFY